MSTTLTDATIGFHHPDGLIQPGGRTWAALNDPFLLQELMLSLEGAIHSIENMSPNPQPAHPVVRQHDLEFYDWDKNGVITPVNFSAHPGKLCWGAKVSGGFKDKVFEICKALGINPDYLMACMAFETGETFSPSIVNNHGRQPTTNAVGLIQFMPQFAPFTTGKTVEQLKEMSAVEQLTYVEKFLMPYKGKMHTLIDVYMAILSPAYIGDSPDTVRFQTPSKAYIENSGLDLNKDGKITLSEIATKVSTEYQRGMENGNFG